MEVLHNIKTKLAAEGHDTAAIDEAEQARRAAYDPDQERLQKTFPATFADELPEQASGGEICTPAIQGGRSAEVCPPIPSARGSASAAATDYRGHAGEWPHRAARQHGYHSNSPVIFAPKPGSTEMRFCFDCRALNKTLADYHYPSPTTEELLDRVTRFHQEAKLAGVEGPVW